MKKFNLISFILITFLSLPSCQTLKKGFQSQKKNSTDEFLVEKKSPLVMPPDYDKLPMPKQNQINDQKETTNQIEELIAIDNSKDDSLNKNDSLNQNTENFILDKIKK